MRTRRGFTLIEIMLATMLAGVVAATCFALLSGVGKAESTSRRTATEITELQRAHSVFQRAFRQIYVAELGRATGPAGAGGAGGTGGTITPNSPGGGSGSGAPAAPSTSGTVTDNPIEAARAAGVSAFPYHNVDNNSTYVQGVPPLAGSGGTTRGPDRLMAGPSGTISEERRAAQTGTSSSSGSDGASGAATTANSKPAPQPRVLLDTNRWDGTFTLEMVLSETPSALPMGTDPGLAFAVTRGAFVLKPPQPRYRPDGSVIVDTVAISNDPDNPNPQTFDLVWEVYPFSSTPGPDREVIAGVTIASGVKKIAYTFYKTNRQTMKLEPTSISTCSTAQDLPAYAQVELTLATGKNVRWLFEIGWTTGAEPDIDLNETVAAVDGNGNPVAGGSSGRGSTGAAANSGRGGRETEADRRGIEQPRSFRSREEKLRYKLNQQLGIEP